MSFKQTVIHRLFHERMIRKLDIPDDVFLAACQLGKDRRQQILTPKPLQSGWHFFPMPGSQHL